ncbi:hypothetical protein [Sphingopyxis macrogoltabida]|nr:hypothetical protein [Sphingopyxis macrogoltabida]
MLDLVALLADAGITDYENFLAVGLNQLRAADADTIPIPEVAAEIATHLTIRTAHFRRFAAGAGSQMLGAIDNLLQSDPAAFALSSDRKSLSKLMREQLAEEWSFNRQKFEAIGIDQNSMLDIVQRYFEQNGEMFFADASKLMGQALKQGSLGVAQIATDAQRSALSRHLVPPARFEKLKTLRWSVLEGCDLVLPDCVGLAQDHQNEWMPVILADLDQLKSMYLPISHDRALMGTHSEHHASETPSVEILAGCSWDFFVSRDRSERALAAKGLIRSRVTEFTDRVISNSIAEVLAENE